MRSFQLDSFGRRPAHYACFRVTIGYCYLIFEDWGSSIASEGSKYPTIEQGWVLAGTGSRGPGMDSTRDIGSEGIGVLDKWRGAITWPRTALGVSLACSGQKCTSRLTYSLLSEFKELTFVVKFAVSGFEPAWARFFGKGGFNTNELSVLSKWRVELMNEFGRVLLVPWCGVLVPHGRRNRHSLYHIGILPQQLLTLLPRITNGGFILKIGNPVHLGCL